MSDADNIWKNKYEVWQKKYEVAIGLYFAKSNVIFPPEDFMELKLEACQGAADRIMRKAPEENLYKELISKFTKHLLPDDDSVACADDISETSHPTKSQTSQEGSTGQHDNNNKKEKKEKIKACIIPGFPEQYEPERAHQLPDGPTCACWWPPIALAMIGGGGLVHKFYDTKINSHDITDGVKKQMEHRLYDALVMLALGSATSAKTSMRSHPRNFVFVPSPHDKYYAKGFNWVIIPLIPIDKIRDWDGGVYDVAIFTGEDYVDESERPKPHAAEAGGGDPVSEASAKESETILFSQMNDDMSEKIVTNDDGGKRYLCTTKDLKVLEDNLVFFCRAFADLHTRTGENTFNFKDLKPAVDKAEKAKKDKRVEAAITLLKTEGVTFTPTDAAEDEVATNDGTRGYTNAIMANFDDVTEKLKQPIKLLPVLKDPDVQDGADDAIAFFGGKPVFKCPVNEVVPVDPIAAGFKGANNLYRQHGIKFAPGCFGNSDADVDSRASSHDGSALMQSHQIIGSHVVTPSPAQVMRSPSPGGLDPDWNTIDDDASSVVSDISH